MQKVGTNVVELEGPNGIALFSYHSLVAVVLNGRKFRTAAHCSQATARHIMLFMPGGPGGAREVSAEVLSILAGHALSNEPALVELAKTSLELIGNQRKPNAETMGSAVNHVGALRDALAKSQPEEVR